MIIPEPILNPLHPHEDVNCKLIDVETGDYSEFKMNVDASINRCQDYTVWQKKGIDDYFYSLVRLKNNNKEKLIFTQRKELIMIVSVDLGTKY